MEITTFQLANIALVLVALFIVFKYLETFWSYKISKPYAWERAVKSKKLDKRLVRMERTFRDRVRFYNIWLQIERLKKNKIKGAFAELGVYKGETAKAIHLMDETRKLYLFDTFDGFSANDLKSESQNEARFTKEMFDDTSLEEVKVYLAGNELVEFKPGFFPDTAAGLEKEIFSFVHIDADLYKPTKAALNFFYPRLAEQGVIIIHDYNHNWNGIPKALDEFIVTIPESLIEIPDWQGSAMIIKNA